MDDIGKVDIFCESRPDFNQSEKIKILFLETDYILLLDISSAIGYSKLDNKGIVSKAAKINTTGVQTINNRERQSYTQISLPQLKNCESNVNNATLHDTYNGEQELKSYEEDNLITLRILATNVYPIVPSKVNDLLKTTSNIKTMEFSPEIIQIVCDPRAKLAKVVDIHWNLVNCNIFAASLTFDNSGGIAIFSLKNPLYAERYYKFQNPVSCASFSLRSPNLLAVGFTIGDLWILDVSSAYLKIIHKMSAFTHEIIQFIQWWDFEETEGIIFGCASKIHCLKRQFPLFHLSTIMTLIYADTEVFRTAGPSLTLGPIVTCLLRNLIDKDQYATGGTDGYLRISSLKRSAGHLKMIKAHNGFICAMKTLPYCNKMFASCGNDGFIKLWMWNLDDAILYCQKEYTALIDLSWSPLHATVVVAISTDSLYVWDIRRKTYSPIATKQFQYQLLNVEFSNCGKWITIGTADGKVVFVTLLNMPRPEYLKKQGFYNAVVRNLENSGMKPLSVEIQKILK